MDFGEFLRHGFVLGLERRDNYGLERIIGRIYSWKILVGFLVIWFY